MFSVDIVCGLYPYEIGLHQFSAHDICFVYKWEIVLRLLNCTSHHLGTCFMCVCCDVL